MTRASNASSKAGRSVPLADMLPPEIKENVLAFATFPTLAIARGTNCAMKDLAEREIIRRVKRRKEPLCVRVHRRWFLCDDISQTTDGKRLRLRFLPFISSHVLRFSNLLCGDDFLELLYSFIRATSQARNLLGHPGIAHADTQRKASCKREMKEITDTITHNINRMIGWGDIITKVVRDSLTITLHGLRLCSYTVPSNSNYDWSHNLSVHPRYHHNICVDRPDRTPMFRPNVPKNRDSELDFFVDKVSHRKTRASAQGSCEVEWFARPDGKLFMLGIGTEVGWDELFRMRTRKHDEELALYTKSYGEIYEIVEKSKLVKKARQRFATGAGQLA